jgi:abequosyltransferase
LGSIDNPQKPLVSICIPTFNRCEYLNKSLDSLVKQPEFCSGCVEIIISDNASTDETETICREYSGKYNNFHYYRNSENIHDRNFPLVISYATGNLIKLCNDTLIYLPDSLKLLCFIEEKYNKEKPVLFFMNNEKDVFGLSTSQLDNLDFEKFICSISYNITWIGGASFWEEDCKNIANDIDGCELSLWQVKKICNILCHKRNGSVLYKHFADIQNVYKKDISYGLYNVFYNNYLGIIRYYVDNNYLSFKCWDFLEKDLLFNFFTEWMIQWEFKNKNLRYSNKENLKQVIFNQYKDKPYFHSFKKYYKNMKAKYIVKRIAKTVFGLVFACRKKVCR